jgi:hypothetical protein
LDRVEGERRVWHSGQCSGYTTWISIYPELERGLVVSTPVSGAVDLLQALDLHHVRGIALDWARCRLRAAEESPGGRVPEGEFPAGRFAHPGYGSLEIFPREGEMWSRFQCAAATPLQRSAQGEVKLALSEYGVSFPITVPTQEQLQVPFEPQVPPIRFSRR